MAQGSNCLKNAQQPPVFLASISAFFWVDNYGMDSAVQMPSALEISPQHLPKVLISFWNASKNACIVIVHMPDTDSQSWEGPCSERKNLNVWIVPYHAAFSVLWMVVVITNWACFEEEAVTPHILFGFMHSLFTSVACFKLLNYSIYKAEKIYDYNLNFLVQ